jgi:hypothetical protein
MLKTCNNKWTLGNVELIMPPMPEDFMKQPGMYCLHTTFDKRIGKEVVVVLYEDTEYINELKKIKLFKFNMSSLTINTSYGPVGVFIFYFDDPLQKDKSIAIFEKPVNIADYNHLKPWLELADQTHIHVILVNKLYEVIGFYEYENTYNFEKAIDIFMKLNPELVSDFNKALEEYNKDYSLEYLYQLLKKNIKK